MQNEYNLIYEVKQELIRFASSWTVDGVALPSNENLPRLQGFLQ